MKRPIFASSHSRIELERPVARTLRGCLPSARFPFSHRSIPFLKRSQPGNPTVSKSKKPQCRTPRFLLVCLMAVASSLAACGAEQAGARHGAYGTARQPQAPVAANAEAVPSSALEGLLVALASNDQAEWAAFDAVDGVRWNGSREASAAEASPPGAMSRSGQLLLVGFGETELPDGNVGADAGTRRGNEGEAGVTLEGDDRHVREIGVNKFHAEDRYRDVIDNQLSDAWRIDLLADGCQLEEGGDANASNVSDNAFYILTRGGRRIYAEATRQDGGNSGPGNTIYQFSMDDPAERISAMKCQRKPL